MSGAAASAGPYSSQQHGGQQGFGESYGARRESGDASANLGAPSQRAPPAQQQQHHQPRPSLPPDALSSQTILHPRKPARSYSGPVPLDPVDARSSPSGAADIRPHTPEETTGRRAPSSGCAPSSPRCLSWACSAHSVLPAQPSRCVPRSLPARASARAAVFVKTIRAPPSGSSLTAPPCSPPRSPEPRNGDSFPGPFPPDFPPSHPYAHASPEQQQALDELRRQSILPGAAACAGWDEALSPSSRVQQRLAVPPAQLDPQALTLATELRKEGVRLMQLNQNAAADIVFTEGLRVGFLGAGSAALRRSLARSLLAAWRADSRAAPTPTPHPQCNPGDAQMLSSRVTCRSRLGRHADAMMDAFAVTQLVPDWHRGHFQVGVAMEAQGRYEEAAAAFDRAVSLARLTACEQGVLREYMRRLDRVRWLSRGHTEVLRSVERIMKKAGQKPPTALAAAAGGAASPAR